MVLGKYINNDNTTSHGSVTELNKKYGANFSFNNQEWTGEESIAETLKHVSQEASYPGENSNLQKITNQYFDWFINSNAPLPKENLFNGIQND